MSAVALRILRPVGLRHLVAECRRLFEGVAEGFAAAHRYERLSAMSDHDLARLGISRQDVPRVAVFGAARGR